MVLTPAPADTHANTGLVPAVSVSAELLAVGAGADRSAGAAGVALEEVAARIALVEGGGGESVLKGRVLVWVLFWFFLVARGCAAGTRRGGRSAGAVGGWVLLCGWVGMSRLRYRSAIAVCMVLAQRSRRAVML
jgi:hypothetical protein